MEIRRWITVDIFFKKNEEEQANKLVKRYEARGYWRNDVEGVDEWEGDIQLTGNVSIKRKEN